MKGHNFHTLISRSSLDSPTLESKVLDLRKRLVLASTCDRVRTMCVRETVRVTIRHSQSRQSDCWLRQHSEYAN